MKRKAYARAGVDIDLGNKVKSALPRMLRATHRPEVLGKVGGFGGLFALDVKKYREPVLVFEGLDCFAHVLLNGIWETSAENMLVPVLYHSQPAHRFHDHRALQRYHRYACVIFQSGRYSLPSTFHLHPLGCRHRGQCYLRQRQPAFPDA